MENGKTLAELGVKAGDVVSWNNKKEYTIGGIRDYGRYYQKDSDPWTTLSTDARWSIVSRTTPQDPTPPRKMHPDDFVNAVNDFAEDNGFGVTQLDFHGKEFIGAALPRHYYSV